MALKTDAGGVVAGIVGMEGGDGEVGRSADAVTVASGVVDGQPDPGGAG